MDSVSPLRPAMRASHMQSNLTSLAEFGPEAEAEIRRRAADAVQPIEEAVRVAWLPIELDEQINVAIVAVAGEEGLRRSARRSMAVSVDGPLFGPLHRAAVALGLTPFSPLKRVPYGWTLVYRNCGRFTYERHGPAAAVLTHHDPPPVMRDSHPYQVGIAGSYEGVMVIGGAKSCRCEIEVGGDVVRYLCRWD